MEEAIKNKITELLIDKTDWKPAKFGEVAIQQKKSVDRENTSLTRYVKGEHMGSEDLHLREWGELTDEYLGPAFIRYFEKDDILYGSRRTYLRKVVIAPFEGITSNTTFVIKANEKKIDKRLLPFIMMTDDFTEHSVKNSKGSVNPYINWKDISEYEFQLPPKDQQAQLAELLWAIDEVIEKEKDVLNKLEIIKESLFNQFQKNNTNWKKIKIDDLMSFNYGKALKESERIEGDNFVVTSSGIQGTHKYFLTKGPGIVVGRKGNVGQVTWVDNNFWTTDTAYYITIKSNYSEIPLKFFYYLLKSVHLEKLSIATAVPGLNRDDALLTRVFLPTNNEIIVYLNKFQSLDEQIVQLETKIQSSHSLQKSLINQVF
jgi:type I restriction enzyme S subunit